MESMTNVYTWSKTAGSNATADSGVNMAEGMLPSAVNDGIRVIMARVASWRDDHGAIALSGTNTITVATNSVLSLATGREIIAKVGTTNTGAATLNANSLGAKAVKKISSAGEADVAAGDLKAGALAHLVYDAAANSSSGAWILLNPTVPVVGVDAQAYDAELAAIAGLTSAADKVPYFTGSGTAAVADFTASGRDLVAQDIDSDQYVYGDGAGSWAVGSITSAGRAILDDADASAQRSTLGLGTAAVVAYTAGTWSPTAAFATAGTSSMSYAVQTGNYVRIGNVVIFDLIINFTPTIGTASGDLRISLPTAAAGQTALSVASSTNTLTWPGSATSLTAMTASSQAYFTIRVLKSAANAATIGTTDMTGGSAHGFIVSGAYIAS